MIRVEAGLLAHPDGIAPAQQTQGEKRLEESQFVLIDADGIECAHVQGAHFHVLHARALQCLGRTFARARDPLRADEAVIFVFDLQDIGVELLIFAADLHADFFVRRVGRADGPRQVPYIFIQAVDGYVDVRLILVPIADVAHAQRRPVGLVQGVLIELRQRRPASPRRNFSTPPATCRTGTAPASRSAGSCAVRPKYCSDMKSWLGCFERLMCASVSQRGAENE